MKLKISVLIISVIAILGGIAPAEGKIDPAETLKKITAVESGRYRYVKFTITRIGKNKNKVIVTAERKSEPAAMSVLYSAFAPFPVPADTRAS